MDGVIARHRLEQVVRPMSIFRSVVLLRIKTGAGENAIEQTRGNLVRDDGFDRWPADVKLAPPRMMRGEINRIRRDFRLKNRGDRLRFARQSAFHPPKLRRVQRRQLHHRHPYSALVVQQFTAQRFGKSLEGMLGRAIC